jgi:hypothetical protein
VLVSIPDERTGLGKNRNRKVEDQRHWVDSRYPVGTPLRPPSWDVLRVIVMGGCGQV